MKKISIIFLTVHFFTGVMAQTGGRDEFDQFIEKQMQKDSIPGASLIITLNGKILKSSAYGFSNLEHKIPAKSETVYELASISKPITATAIMILAEEGKLSLDSSVSNYLDNVPANYSGITLRRLMSHTAGIVSDHYNYFKLYGPSPLRYSVKDQLDDLFKIKLTAEPGTQYNYSNAGFFLQAAIIEKLSGKPYQEFIRANIFNKAGMKQSFFINGDSLIMNRAQGYTKRKSKWVRFSLEQTIQSLDANGFGGDLSTTGDLVRFFEAAAKGNIIKKETFEAMLKPALFKDGSEVTVRGGSKIGLSWFLRQIDGKRCVSHSGHTGTVALFFPDHGLSIVFLLTWDKVMFLLGDKGYQAANVGFELAEMAAKKYLRK